MGRYENKHNYLWKVPSSNYVINNMEENSVRFYCNIIVVKMFILGLH